MTIFGEISPLCRVFGNLFRARLVIVKNWTYFGKKIAIRQAYIVVSKWPNIENYPRFFVGRLDSWVVFTLNSWILVYYALGHEFEPWWWQTLFWTQAQHICFIHDSIWFIWFDTFICLSNLSCEWTTASIDLHQMAVHKRTTMLAHWNLKQNTWLCSKQSSLFSFYALPSGGKSKDEVVHCETKNCK